MKAKKLIVAATVALMAMVARADLYVDAAADSASADGTAEHPYATIQAAVDVASAGATIRIAEGVYDQGGKEFEGYTHARVYIGKALHLIGAGRGKTVIVGERAATSDGRGVGARRCIHTNWAHGTIIEGVTLKGGSTKSPTSSAYGSESGGGIYCEGGSGSDPLDVYLVDSEFVDCIAGYGGAARGATHVRCLMDGCGADQGLAAYKSRLVNCVATRSRPLNTAYTTDGVVCESTIVNCTLVDNAANSALINSSHVFNSVVLLSAAKEENRNNTSEITDSVLSSSAAHGKMQLLAPAVGDWRLLSTSDAVGLADVSALTGLSLPAGVDPLVDFTGKAIVAVAGRINAGAIQEKVAPAGGALYFADNNTDLVPLVADGRTNAFVYATYVIPEIYPTQYVFTASAEGKALCRLARKNASGAYTIPLGFAPSMDDTFRLIPPPDVGTAVTNFFEFGTVTWTDPASGNDSNPGTEAEPFKTLAAAVGSITDLGSSGKHVIRAKRGIYNEGTMSYAGHDFRVVVDAGTYGRIRIVAVDGPEETFIVGAPDPGSTETGALAGCGPAGVRGVYLVGNCNVSLQGFTITGCYSSDKTTYTSPPNGAAIFSEKDERRAEFTDCIISNNYGYKSVVYCGLLKRCRVVGNTSAETIFGGGGSETPPISADWKSSTAAFCVFANNTLANPSDTQGLIGGAARVFNCTVVGATDAGRVSGGKSAFSLNTIYYGGEAVYGAETMANCVVWGCADTSAVSGGNKVENPVFVSRRLGDYRVGNRSPCVGYAATVDTGDFWQVFDGAMDGALVFRNGRAVVGAYQRTEFVDEKGLLLLFK